MSQVFKVILIIILILIAILAILYIIGSRLQDQQIEQEQAMEAAKQTASILVIDKKKLRYKEAGLPSIIYEGAPKYMKIMNPKVPVVKAKVGPKIVNLISDPAVYDQLPLKTECKVDISGIYITALKSVRGKAVVPEPKKKGFFGNIVNKMRSMAKRGHEQRKQELGIDTKKK